MSIAWTNELPLIGRPYQQRGKLFSQSFRRIKSRKLEPLPDAIIDENVFFLRIMADHAKFIGHLLDPSERNLIEQARDFSHDFDQLLFQAKDLDSMRPQSQTPPLLNQFLDQNRVSVKIIA